MQDEIILTNRGSQTFGIGERCAFLVWYGAVIAHGILVVSNVSADIWQQVLSGDYTQIDVVKAIAISVVAFPLLLAFYSAILFGPVIEPEHRFATLEAGDLVLTRQFIFGFSRTRRVPIGQIAQVGLDQQEGDGSPPLHTLWVEIRNKGRLALTGPETDRIQMETLADRLRTGLRSAGWTEASAPRPGEGNPQAGSALSHPPRP